LKTKELNKTNFTDETAFAEKLSNFNLITSILITIIGVIGNAISFSIFISKQFRDQSMNRWLAVLTNNTILFILILNLVFLLVIIFFSFP
jgi:TRAP-type C4-dicarboxylate transport system permease large subunit